MVGIQSDAGFGYLRYHDAGLVSRGVFQPELVAGFGVFAFASFIPNRSFGVMVASILTIALACDAFLLPALLLIKRGNEPAPPSAAS